MIRTAPVILEFHFTIGNLIMQTKQKITFIILIVLIGLCQRVSALTPADFELNGISYRFSEDGQSLIVCKSITGYKGEVTVPSTVLHNGKSYPVSEIDIYAFADCDELKSVSLKCKIKEIPKNCFERSHNLETVELPKGIECIRYEAFKNSGLRDVYLPDGLKEIEGHVFDGTNVERVVIPSTVTALGDWNFYKCQQLQSLIIPGSIVRLLSHTIRACKRLKKIELGEGLVFLDDAFYECDSLESLDIPSTVKHIGYRYSYRLQRISVDSGNKWYDSRNDCNALIETATNKLILGCINTVIPENVTSIGGAFRACEGLKTALIPANVESIDGAAFDENQLDSVIIQDGNKLIQLYWNTFTAYLPDGAYSTAKYLYMGRNASNYNRPAFESFPNLETIIIGESVDSLMMEGCKHDVSVYAKSMSPSHFDFSFGDDTEAVFESATLYVPKGTRELYMATEGWNRFLNIVEYDATGISSVRSASDSKAIYNINGHRLASPQKGINIIRNNDGTIRKEFVK